MQGIIHRYSLREQLTSKQFRSTYLGYTTSDDHDQVVIKIFEPECLNHDLDQQSSLAHLTALHQLMHPSICAIRSINVEEKRLYIVSEYSSGGSLRAHLDASLTNSVQWVQALDIVCQIGTALDFAHKHSLLHGNVKPENVLYRADNTILLTDFSTAPVIDVSRLDYKSDLSTMRYMAPERFMGVVQPEGDQYALACLAYELLTGFAPFNEASFSALWKKHASEDVPPPSSLTPDVPKMVDLAVSKALSKDPRQRYGTVADFVAALSRSIPQTLDQLPNFFANTQSAQYVSFDSLQPIDPEINLLYTDPSLQEKENIAQLPTSQLPDALPIHETQMNDVFFATHAQGDYSSDEITDTLSVRPLKISGIALTPQRLHRPQRRFHSASFLIGTILASVIILLALFCIPLVLRGPTSVVVGNRTPLPTSQTPFAHSTLVVLSTQANHTSLGANPLPTQTAIVQNEQPSPIPNEPVVSPTANASPPKTSGSTTSTPVVTPTAVTTSVVPSGAIRISVCGNTIESFIADTDYDTGTCRSMGGEIDMSAITDDAPSSLFLNSRWGPQFTYTISGLTPNYAYTVRLLFAETYWTAAGERLFNVSINKQPFLTNFDIFKTAGASYKAIEEQTRAPATASGTIVISFVGVVDDPFLSGIEVLP